MTNLDNVLDEFNTVFAPFRVDASYDYLPVEDGK